METLGRLIIVDVEADQRTTDGRRDDQVIEIGAVAWDAQRGIADEHRGFVRTTWGPLSPFIVGLCGYTPDEVRSIESAPAFPDAFLTFRAWATAQQGTFASWGDYDRKQLLRDCARHHLPEQDWLLRHVNLKALHSELHRRKPCGMGSALRLLGVELHGRHHVGIDDARNIARIADDLERRLRTRSSPGAP